MSDVYLRERAQDIRELGQRLLYFLHNSEHELRTLDKPIVLVVRELTASVLASIPKEKLLAVVSLEGAANSHAAILSPFWLKHPLVMGVNLNLAEANGKQTIVDGYSGEIFIEPTQSLLSEYKG